MCEYKDDSFHGKMRDVSCTHSLLCPHYFHSILITAFYFTIPAYFKPKSLD